MKILARVVVVIAALLAGLVVTVLLVPVTALGGMILPPSVQVVEGSSLMAGRALVSSRQGSHQLQWRWCPATTVLGFCSSVSAGGGFASAILKPRLTQLIVQDVRISNVSAAVLGIRPTVFAGRLSGAIEQLSIPLDRPCPLQAATAYAGELEIAALRVMGRALEDHRLALVPNEANHQAPRLRIVGPQINGELQVSELGSLGGQLDFVDATAGAPPQPLDINLPLPCGRWQ